jgi:hypothetical protein
MKAIQKSLIIQIIVILLSMAATSLVKASTNSSLMTIYIPIGGNASAHGYLSGYDSRAAFVFQARAGQKLRISTIRGGATVVMIRFANGAIDGAPGGIESNVPTTGYTKITVTEHKMAQPWSGPFTLDIQVR